MKFYCLFLFLISSCFPVTAQTEKKIDKQSILWTRYFNQLLFDKKWSLHTEFDNRLFLKPVEQNVFVFRVQGRYKINEYLETGVGFAYFSVDTQIPEIDPDFNVPEYRFQQDMTLKLNVKRVTVLQRFQLEERFTRNANSLELLPGSIFSWRFRYRLQADYIFRKKENQYLKTVLSDEIMFNFGKKIIQNTFDQNRVYAALQFGMNKNIALELGYLNSFQRRANGIDYFNRDIIRFTIFHKIKIKKKV